MPNLTALFSLADMPTAPFFHHADVEASHHVYNGSSTTLYHVRGEYTVFEDSQTVNQRLKASFRLPQTVHLLGDLHFRGYFEPLGGDAVNGTTVLKNRLVNNAGRLQIREVRMRAGQTAKTGITIPGKLLTLEHYLQTTMRDREALEIFELGGMTPTQRNNAALSRQWFDVKISHPFDVDFDHFLQLHALQDELTVEIYFVDDDEIRDYDGATSYNITRSDLELLCDVRLLATEEADHVLANTVLGDDGLTMYRRDVQWEQKTYTADDIVKGNQIAMELNGFNNEIFAWFATLRYADEIVPTNNTGYDNLQKWHSHWIRDGQNNLIDPVDYQHQVYRINRLYTYHPVGLNAIIHPFAKNITSRDRMSGSLNLSGLTRGEFVIQIDDAMKTEMVDNGRSVVLEVIAGVHNYLTQVARNTGPQRMLAPMVHFSDHFQN